MRMSDIFSKLGKYHRYVFGNHHDDQHNAELRQYAIREDTIAATMKRVREDNLLAHTNLFRTIDEMLADNDQLRFGNRHAQETDKKSRSS